LRLKSPKHYTYKTFNFGHKLNNC